MMSGETNNKPAAPEPLIVAKECAERGCCAHDPRIDGAGVLFHPAALPPLPEELEAYFGPAGAYKPGTDDDHVAFISIAEMRAYARAAIEQIVRERDGAKTFWRLRAERAELQLTAANQLQREHTEQILRLSGERDEARALLREARLQIEYLHGKFQETGTGNALLARIDAFLKEKA